MALQRISQGDPKGYNAQLPFSMPQVIVISSQEAEHILPSQFEVKGLAYINVISVLTSITQMIYKHTQPKEHCCSYSERTQQNYSGVQQKGI